MKIAHHIKGYEGVRSRMAELQSKLNSLNEKPQTQQQQSIQNLAKNPSFQSSFQKELKGHLGKSSLGLENEAVPFDPGFGSLVPSGVSTGTSLDIDSLIIQAAQNHGLDPKLFRALVKQESAFNPTAVSSAGAQGLTQLMPRTAKSLGVTDPFDPVQNLNGGAKYLSQMMKEFGGDISLALAAYNAGPGAVKRAGGIPPYRETQNYVKKILGAYNGG